MQIIFDEKVAKELQQRYVILELDTVKQPDMTEPVTLYAVIENIELEIIPTMLDLIARHVTMIEQYKNSKWEDAIVNANALKGSWKGEIDEFYDIVLTTANKMLENNTTWDGIRYTTPVEE